MPGPTLNPWRKAFTCAACAYLAIILVTRVSMGPPGAGFDASQALGWLFGLVCIAALVTGFFARRSRREWTALRFVIVYVVCLAIVAALSVSGSLQHA